MSAYTALTSATYKAYVRDRTTLVFTFAFPLVFLVVFGLIFHGQSVPGGLSYINYIAPGVLSWAVGNAALFGVAFALMHWRRDDILRLIWRTPTPLPSVLGSRLVVATGVAAVQTALFTGIALLPVFGLRLSGTWPLSLPVLFFGVTAFLALGLVVGAAANTPEAVAAIANSIMIPMAFLSGAFYPKQLLPGWVQAIARVLPLRYLDDGFTDAFAGHRAVSGTVVSCAALALFTAVFALLAARTFRWSNQT